MFFQAINQMITAGTDLSINIRRVNNNLTVAVVPRRSGVKDGERIVPLILNGTPEELDAGFLQAVGTPVQKAQGILTNLEAFEKQCQSPYWTGHCLQKLLPCTPIHHHQSPDNYIRLLSSDNLSG